MPIAKLGTDYQLRYVRACQECRWHLKLWRRDNPSERWYVPFTCRSWRCKGRCQLWKGAQDFRRVQEGVNSREWWVVLTLTYDPRGWKNQWAMWRGGMHLWDKLRKRFVREWGKMDYVQTWEAHASGQPHVNVAISNQNFWTACCVDWQLIRRTWVKPHVRASGFGNILYVTVAYDLDGMAGYFTKLARELTGTAKKDQTPYNAPPHFRRLRPSQGLLPPPYKDDRIAGKLKFRPLRPEELL